MNESRERFEAWRAKVNRVPSGDEPGYPSEPWLRYPDQEHAAWLGWEAARAVYEAPPRDPVAMRFRFEGGPWVTTDEPESMRELPGNPIFECEMLYAAVPGEAPPLKPKDQDHLAVQPWMPSDCSPTPTDDEECE